METKIPDGPLLIEQTRVVPAGEYSRLGIPGEFFRVTEANYGFSIGLNDAPGIPWDLGMQYRCPAGTFFSSVTIYNSLAVDLVITVMIGRGKIDDDRLNVIERRNGSAPSTIPPTFSAPEAVPGSSGAWVKLVDADPNRAAIVVSRTAPFILVPESGAVAGRVCAPIVSGYYTATLETKAEVWGFDLGASAADFNVAELLF